MSRIGKDRCRAAVGVSRPFGRAVRVKGRRPGSLHRTASPVASETSAVRSARGKSKPRPGGGAVAATMVRLVRRGRRLQEESGSGGVGWPRRLLPESRPRVRLRAGFEIPHAGVRTTPRLEWWSRHAAMVGNGARTLRVGAQPTGQGSATRGISSAGRQEKLRVGHAMSKEAVPEAPAQRNNAEGPRVRQQLLPVLAPNKHASQ